MANENRYYKTPFAESGNKTEVPDVSVGGAVGYDTGFGPDYELPQGSVNRKRIERDLYNGMHNGITKNLKQWQENLYPTWIEDNGEGAPFAYDKGMIVSHNDVNYVSLEDANQEEPGAGSEWGLNDDVLINDLSQTYNFEDVAAMKSSTITFPMGKLISTGKTVWRVNSSAGIPVVGAFVTPLNGIFISDFGFAMDGTNEGDLVNAMLSDLSAAGLNNKTLVFSEGILGCSAVKFSSGYKLNFAGGKLKSFAGGGASGYIEATNQSVRIFCAVKAEYTQNIFEWTSTNVTNKVGTDVPFLFGKNDGDANSAPSVVSVRWFGCIGDGTSCPVEATCAAISVSYGVFGGSFGTSLFGTSTLYFPKGLYNMYSPTGETFNVSSGIRILGDGGGSHALSSIYYNSGGLITHSTMYVYGHWANVEKGQQFFLENIGFRVVTTEDFTDGIQEIELGVVEIRTGAGQIDIKVENCWFLGTPNKGGLFIWGNKYDSDNNKIDTGSDSDGLQIFATFSDCFFDVVSMLARVSDKGWGNLTINSCNIFRTDLGLCRNYSDHPNGLTIEVNGGKYQYPNRNDLRRETKTPIGPQTKEHVISNCHLSFRGHTIVNGNNNFNFVFSYKLKDSSVEVHGVTFSGNHIMTQPFLDLTDSTNNKAVVKDSIINGVFTASAASGKSLSIIAKNSGSSVNDSSVVDFSGNEFLGSQGSLVHLVSNGNDLTFAHLDLLVYKDNTAPYFNTPAGIVVGDIDKYFLANNIDSTTPNG